MSLATVEHTIALRIDGTQDATYSLPYAFTVFSFL
jgi:hypothetical protein